MLSKSFYTEFIGYGGGSMSLFAYLLVANNYISGNSGIFLILNLVAGLALMIYTASKKAYANTVLNSFWFLISILSIARLIY